jgi:predicted metal-dependent hydrolase
VLLDLIFGRQPAADAGPVPETIPVGGRQVPLRLVRHPRARRYLLRLLTDGTARVTIPRGGSAGEARRFAERQTAWLETQLQRLQNNPRVATHWAVGTTMLFHGEIVTLLCPAPGMIQWSTELIRIGESANARPAIEKHLRRLATRELPPRVLELAREHQVVVNRVSIRNQRSRWGSCSRHGTISLNWRLIQLPGFVRDYVILHELMHRRQLNHSARFWQEVSGVCPDYPSAENWLRNHASLLSES